MTRNSGSSTHNDASHPSTPATPNSRRVITAGGGDPSLILSLPDFSSSSQTLCEEVLASTEVLFQNKLTLLLLLGPLAVVGDATGLLGEAACFALSGIALIPCAERLSFITEQVAEHTNGTIGALLNATFGNCPEFLISIAALRSGYYRVVQLAMLGSMITNMIFVFGASCLIGGLRWQVQDLRIPSGNVNVVMLFVATAGLLFPAALNVQAANDQSDDGDRSTGPSEEQVAFSRINAVVMLLLYMCFLIFQLGTHKEEFDDDENSRTPTSRRRRARQNLMCLKYMSRARRAILMQEEPSPTNSPTPSPAAANNKSRSSESDIILDTSTGSYHSETGDEEDLLVGHDSGLNNDQQRWRRRRINHGSSHGSNSSGLQLNNTKSTSASKLKASTADFSSDDESHIHVHAPASGSDSHNNSVVSMRVGVTWLLIITLCVSAITDILVDTIDGFAHRMGVSEVFTSIVVIPFFSNVAEQVSAFIFAYRNEMDLCIGVTVGSAIQIATFVLPGSVIIGFFMDRSMTLLFHPYETISMFFGVVMVGAVLQGGSTNWLTGAMLVGTYIVFASGIWFHQEETLTVDEELLIGINTGD